MGSGPQIRAEFLSLKACAESAGMALACDFSSSAEYEAELIAARRAAGRYEPKARLRQRLVMGAAVVCGVGVLMLLTAS